jgi:hypothetical protein
MQASGLPIKSREKSMELRKGAVIIGIAPDVDKYVQNKNMRVSYLEFMNYPHTTKRFTFRRLHVAVRSYHGARLMLAIWNGRIACWMHIARE